jgi:hypothetical protein
MIPVFERAKTVHAFDRAGTVIGLQKSYCGEIQRSENWMIQFPEIDKSGRIF